AALFDPEGLGAASAPARAAWWLSGLQLVAGLASTVSLARAGIQQFWSPADSPPRGLKLVELAPVAALIAASVWLTFRAEPVLSYTRAAAEALHAPGAYITTVLAATPVPPPERDAPEEPSP